MAEAKILAKISNWGTDSGSGRSSKNIFSVRNSINAGSKKSTILKTFFI
jgi:hypothetical protein